MKFLIALSALVAVAFAASGNEPIPIVKQDSEVGVDGSFHHSFESGNGISVHEDGHLKNAGHPEQEALEVHGGFQYTALDGSPVSITYIADENGFQPQGAHLPTPPPAEPIPDYILRSLEYNAAHPEPESKKSRP